MRQFLVLGIVIGILLPAVPVLAQLGPVPIGPTISLPASTGLTDALAIGSTPATTFYRDLPGPHPSAVRLGDRVTIGLADPIPLTSNPTTAQQTWAGALYNMAWLERDATLAVYSTSAGSSVASAARTSDAKLNGVSAFAYTGFAVADTPNAVSEGAYLEARTTAANSSAYGLEIDAVNNSSPTSTTNPYYLNPSGGAYGLMLGAGGDPSNPGPTWPSSFALGVISNKSTWNRGLVFGAASLLNDDGTTGTAVAVEMGKGHQVQWDFDSSGVASGFIRSDGTAAGLGLVFNNTGLTVQSNAGATLGTFTLGGNLTMNGTVAANSLNGTNLAVNAAAIYGNAAVTGTASIGNVSLGSATATGYPTLDIDGVGASQRQTTLSTGGSLRWAYGVQTPETGANAGGDFFISAFTDAGSGMGNDLTITRAAGQVSIAHGLSVGGATALSPGITTTAFAITTAHTPASSTESCIAGQISWDTNYAYVCVAANTWKRTALSAW